MLGSIWPGLNVGRAGAGLGPPAVVGPPGVGLGLSFDGDGAVLVAALDGLESLFWLFATEGEGAASDWLLVEDAGDLADGASAGLNPLDAAETSVFGFSGVQPSGITHVVKSIAINQRRVLDRETATD
jgi:hypothetical protein